MANVLLPCAASKVESIYGVSEGSKVTDRIAFAGFDDEAHHVAVARNVGCFASFFYSFYCVSFQEPDTGEIVWINENSLKKRFSHTLEELDVLVKYLPKIAADSTYIGQRQVLTGQHQLLKFKAAADGCQDQTRLVRQELTTPEIETMRAYRQSQRVDQPRLVGKNRGKPGKPIDPSKPTFARTLLLTPEAGYVLMTSRKRCGDKRIGKGSFKSAKFAVNIDTAAKKVVAVCRRAQCSQEDWDALRSEIAHMNALKGKDGVIQIDVDLTTPDKCYIVMEYCDLGELFDHVALRPGSLSRADQIQIARDCAVGLKNIHELQLLHRDLKMENVFLYRDAQGHIRAKIADLGFACKNDDREQRKRLCGSPHWIPPEKAKLIRAAPSDAQVVAATTEAGDVWSMGLILYALFHPNGRYFDFQTEDNPQEAMRMIAQVRQSYLSNEIALSGINKNLRDLIERMVRVNPSERPTMAEVHEALQNIN